jgi:ribonucleotide monophosphatase NagD (HAD superfamily)
MADPAAVLVALGMTRYWQTKEGLSLDVAPFVVALEHATGKRAVVLGKPAKEFFLAGAARLGLPPERVLMVGDDLRADVEGARGAGLRGCLVRTGKFREADLSGDGDPDLVLDSVADLPRAAW